MTDANKDSWRAEGVNDDRKIDDWFAVRVIADAAGFAADEMFEVTPFGGLDFPIVLVS